MRAKLGLLILASVTAGSIAVAAAQAPPQGRGGAGRQGGNPTATFPAQQRPPGDPALIARGHGLYGVHCRACHGVDLRGGDIGGPNLLRSQLALERSGRRADRTGHHPGPPERQACRPCRRSPLSPDDIKAVAAYIHSVQATMRGQGSPPPGTEVQPNILVGDAKAGQAYFKTNCSSAIRPPAICRGSASADRRPRAAAELVGRRRRRTRPRRRAAAGSAESAPGHGRRHAAERPEGRRASRSDRRLHGAADDGRRRAALVQPRRRRAEGRGARSARASTAGCSRSTPIVTFTT